MLNSPLFDTYLEYLSYLTLLTMVVSGILFTTLSISSDRKEHIFQGLGLIGMTICESFTQPPPVFTVLLCAVASLFTPFRVNYVIRQGIATHPAVTQLLRRGNRAIVTIYTAFFLTVTLLVVATVLKIENPINRHQQSPSKLECRPFCSKRIVISLTTVCKGTSIHQTTRTPCLPEIPASKATEHSLFQAQPHIAQS